MNSVHFCGSLSDIILIQECISVLSLMRSCSAFTNLIYNFYLTGTIAQSYEWHEFYGDLAPSIYGSLNGLQSKEVASEIDASE